MQPTVNVPILGDDPFVRITNYRQNWWCCFAEANQPESTLPNQPVQAQFPPFLSAAERTLARAAQSRIESLPLAPKALTFVVLAWAQAHPDEARTPEALYFSVQSARYGGTDHGTTDWSRAALQLLHCKYPQSVGTRKTKYYFSPEQAPGRFLRQQVLGAGSLTQ